MRDVFPTAASPTRQTFAFMTTDRMDSTRRWVTSCTCPPPQNYHSVIEIRRTRNRASGGACSGSPPRRSQEVLRGRPERLRDRIHFHPEFLEGRCAEERDIVAFADDDDARGFEAVVREPRSAQPPGHPSPVGKGERAFVRRADAQVVCNFPGKDGIRGAGVHDHLQFPGASFVTEAEDPDANAKEAHGFRMMEGGCLIVCERPCETVWSRLGTSDYSQATQRGPTSGARGTGGKGRPPGRGKTGRAIDFRSGSRTCTAASGSGEMDSNRRRRCLLRYSPSSRKPPNWPHAMRAPRRWNARSTPAPVFADVMRNSAPQPSATFWISAWPNSPFASRSALFTAMRTGTRMTTFPTASIQPETPSSVLRRVRSATARTPLDPAKYAFLSSSRKVSSPMTSQIVMSSCTSRCFSLIGMRSSLFVTFAPRVVSYRSSYWSRTYLRMRDVFPTAASPTRQTFAFITTDRMDSTRRWVASSARPPPQNYYSVIEFRRLRNGASGGVTCDSSVRAASSLAGGDALDPRRPIPHGRTDNPVWAKFSSNAEQLILGLGDAGLDQLHAI